jgi:general secretion pathway protein L
MSRRFFGIDIDRSSVRVAIAGEEKGEIRLLAILHAPCDPPGEPDSALQELLGADKQLGDRMAAALPAGVAFVRRLTFPFAESRKITAALPFELAARLPTSIDDFILAHQPPREEEGIFAVTAAAVDPAVIAPVLAPFDAALLPLQILDLAPFAQAAGLRSQIPEGILALLFEEEIIVALVEDGRVLDHRLLPVSTMPTEDKILSFVLKESEALQRGAGRSGLVLVPIGPGATPSLLDGLSRQWEKVMIPPFFLDGAEVPPEFIPAVALALRAARGEKEGGINFRRGSFALKSEWGALKRGLIAAAILATLGIAIFIASAWLGYADRARQAESLHQEMTRAFRETFPGTPLLAEVPLQMQSKINELENRARLLGVGPQGSALALLNEISLRTPADLKVDIREFTYTPETLRLDGSTSSFDAINRLAQSLGASPMFGTPQISDAKMSLDGSLVDFRLQLPLLVPKESP